MNFDTMTFATDIRQNAKRRGLTLCAAMEEINYSHKIISKWERGIHEPSVEAICAFCQWMDVEPGKYFKR